MMLQKSFSRVASKHTAMLPSTQYVGARRPYFSVFDKMKDRFNTPLKHIKSFVEPDGYNHESQLPSGYRLHGNTAATFSAHLTKNAIELNQWHEMEATVHSQFGTVDNPVLIFT